MNPYYTIVLLAFLVLLAILLVRYVTLTVDQEFRRLARASTDPEYRREELERAGRELAGALPLPGDAAPLPGPSSGHRGALAPVLLALGVILVWGAGSAPKDRALWFYGGVTALALAAAIMLVALRRRKSSRTARLLLYRADLRRMDNDRIGAADDLVQLLRLTPWDDSAWAELSDDLSAQGKLPQALEALERAAGIDPAYDEYRMLEASLAIRMGDLPRAREAIAGWRGIAGVRGDDPRLGIYCAALHLAEGDREKAADSVRRLLLDHDADGMEFLDADQALDGVRKLLPGRT